MPSNSFGQVSCERDGKHISHLIICQKTTIILVTCKSSLLQLPAKTVMPQTPSNIQEHQHFYMLSDMLVKFMNNYIMPSFISGWYFLMQNRGLPKVFF